ncbi:MAG: flagellar export chaperone FlgN [Candidatus Krumholzibacteriia bacterium]
MSSSTRESILTAQEAREICSLLEAEERAYRRLVRLTRRQNRYLGCHDLGRLESNAAEWGKYLPLATAARRARESYVADCARRLGFTAPPPSPTALLDYAPMDVKTAVRSRVSGLLAVTTELARRNELNRHLTRYCLDLLQEETEIFRNGVLQDPAGRYGGDARRTTAGPGGVLVRQA